MPRLGLNCSAAGSSRSPKFLPARQGAAGQPALSLMLRMLRQSAPVLGVGVFLLAMGALSFISYVLLPVSNSRSAVADVVRIPPGASTREIAHLLAESGIVRNPDYFVWASRLFRLEERLQAGDYELSPAMNLMTVLERLERGDVATVRVTIPEGLNAREIGAMLAERGLIDYEAFLERVADGRDLIADIVPFAVPIRSVEGYLFPDTYWFPRSISEEEIIRRMVARFVQQAYPLMAGGQLEANLEVHEVTTLASIVEKEAMRDAERPQIAAVFLNRLAIGKPLQADPTVQYVMPNPRPRLYYRDLAIDSPYNTYRYPGLPPGPIASPGLASLRAVLEPAETDYLYFVARGDGTHVFSRTFAEHVAARRKVGR